MPKKILITGGCGFIGSHYVRMILKQTDWQVVNVDLLTYAGNLANVEDVSMDPRYDFVKADIADKNAMRAIFEQGVDYVVHFAAESHVDNSITDANPFIKTNIAGTQVLLDLAKEFEVKRFIYISTDEVYGDWPVDSTDKFTENSPLNPSSPYSATKASGDLLSLAYARTYKLPVIITRCTNNYGTHQYPEKLIPTFVKKLIQGKKVPIYGNGKNIREWLEVRDHCNAIQLILKQGQTGEVYNIGSGEEINNLEITKMICETLGKNFEDNIEYVTDRLGHDRRYALNSSKIRALGWKPQHEFSQNLQNTVEWYQLQFDKK